MASLRITKYLVKLKEFFKHHFEEILTTKKSPVSIASGFAIGTIIAILPTFGLGVFIGLFLLSIFENINKYSLMLSFAIWNPFVLAPLQGLSFKVGGYFVTSQKVEIFDITVFNEIYRYTSRFLIGNLVVALSVGVISFVLLYLVSYLIYKFRGITTD